MSNYPPRQTNSRFYLWAVLVTLGTSSLLAASWPHLGNARRAQARLAQTRAGDEQGSSRDLDLRLANLLEPQLPVPAARVAWLELDNQNAPAAERTLNLVRNDGAGESAVLSARIATDLELGHLQAASAAADQLLTGPTADSDTALAAMAYGVSGEGDKIKPLLNRTTSLETITAIKRAGAGKLTLGLDLAAVGLLRSSERLLQTEPVSIPRNQTLATIAEGQGTKDGYIEAARLYQASLTLDPSNVTMRRQLVLVLRLGKQPGISNQLAKIKLLESGTP